MDFWFKKRKCETWISYLINRYQIFESLDKIITIILFIIVTKSVIIIINFRAAETEGYFKIIANMLEINDQEKIKL